MFGGQNEKRECNNNLYYITYQGTMGVDFSLVCNQLPAKPNWPSPRAYHTSTASSLLFLLIYLKFYFEKMEENN